MEIHDTSLFLKGEAHQEAENKRVARDAKIGIRGKNKTKEMLWDLKKTDAKIDKATGTDIMSNVKNAIIKDDKHIIKTPNTKTQEQILVPDSRDDIIYTDTTGGF